MLADLAGNTVTLDPNEVCCPQDSQRIVERFERPEQIAYHRQAPKIGFAIIEYTLCDRQKIAFPGRLEFRQEFVGEIIGIAHPEVESLQARLGVQDAHNIASPAACLICFAGRLNAGEQANGCLSFAGNSYFCHLKSTLLSIFVNLPRRPPLFLCTRSLGKD